MSLTEHSARFNTSNSLFDSSDAQKTYAQYTPTDIGNHDVAEDCWIALNKDVFDVSKYKHDLNREDNIKLGIRCGKTYDFHNVNNTFRFEPDNWASKDKEKYGNRYSQKYKIGEVKNYYRNIIFKYFLIVVVIILLVVALIYTQKPIFGLLLSLVIFYYGIKIVNNYHDKVAKANVIIDQTQNTLA